MTAPLLDLEQDTVPIRGGWRVTRPDGSQRTVFQRPSLDGWAVFSGDSTDQAREPELGYGGSWHRGPQQAIAWARTAVVS